MSIYYDLYKGGNPLKREEEQPLYPRVISSGTLSAQKFIELVSKSNGYSEAILKGTLQAITDELYRWLSQGWMVEVGELGHFSLSLKCSRKVMDKKEIRSPSIQLNKINLQINRDFRKKFATMRIERKDSICHLCSNHSTDEYRELLQKHLNEEGCISRINFMQLAGISKDKAIGLLNSFIEEGIIRTYGSGKNVVYLPVKTDR